MHLFASTATKLIFVIRFALEEVSVILTTLLDTFEFRERDEGGTPIVRTCF